MLDDGIITPGARLQPPAHVDVWGEGEVMGGDIYSGMREGWEQARLPPVPPVRAG